MSSIAFAALFVITGFNDRDEASQRCIQEPAQPNTLTFTALPYSIHSIVPITTPHQWQTVLTYRKAMLNRAYTVIVNIPGVTRDARFHISIMFIGAKQRLLKIWDHFIEN
jgi:hypothetical protein